MMSGGVVGGGSMQNSSTTGGGGIGSATGAGSGGGVAVTTAMAATAETTTPLMAALMAQAGLESSSGIASPDPWRTCSAEEARQRDEHGATALHWAIWFSNVEAFECLLKVAPDVARAVTKEGHTPLMWACVRGETAYTLHFLRALTAVYPEGVHDTDTNGLTTLILAIQGVNKLAALFLLYRGVDPNAADKSGAGPLAWAAFLGDADFLFLLAGSGADVNNTDSKGMTPLHRAAQRGQHKFVACLLDWPFNKYGVKRHVLNADNLSPLDIAKEMHHEDVVRKIKSAARAPSALNPRAYPKRFPRFYITAVALCAGLWLAYLLPVTWESLTPSYHYFAAFLLVTWLANWLYMIKIDPGTATTHAAQHRLRKAVLEKGAHLDSGDICYTCKIIKPLRSKHDAVTNACFYRFDHFCGWIGGVVAEDNYPNFVLHVYIELLGHLLFLHMCIQAQRQESALQSPLLVLLFLASLAVNTFGLVFAGILVYEHTKMVTTNMTTNEYINRSKYDHFVKQTRKGAQFVNPFNKGVWHNLKVMLTRAPRRRVYHKDGSITLAQ
ncbi:hypothetical protein PTSG_04668 [Salpingoeca rosetta]|uniref:Palmitoyltransferase n=1 Tax=Salpingoeca rosetta (strain ATCC 50818 / BSB-021) TaxID=946362 RepID=F2U831_SALR5|nr:uncharacterized protein PTSG_04668 [Salpingoeca rosetta]EGD72936.1 hypothetical protein PTSG_04668 [Salpingoeca rosetta]|eukprot:XP_004994758.1 hypothetical protein PTSG_04668 [Salpingoeca rosetta]